MKSFSSQVITPEQLTSLEQCVHARVDEIDEAQNKAIAAIRRVGYWVIGVSLCVSVALGAAVYSLNKEVHVLQDAVRVMQPGDTSTTPT